MGFLTIDIKLIIQSKIKSNQDLVYTNMFNPYRNLIWKQQYFLNSR
jgi:hypothetical protein